MKAFWKIWVIRGEVILLIESTTTEITSHPTAAGRQGSSRPIIEGAPVLLHPFSDAEIKQRCPHYSLVPKDLDANLKFRREMLAMGASSRANARAIWEMCREDLLFYINTFCFCYEPRPKGELGARLPFITWPYQDQAMIKLQSVLGREDLLIEKSRDTGGSWCVLSVLEHAWHYHDGVTFLLLSRVEDLVDKTEDPRALMWKLDHLLEFQPKWLLPKMNRQRLHLINYDTGSTIDGASTTGEAATGDRRTAIFIDEAAKIQEGFALLSSTRDASDSRIFLSTPMGSVDAFASLRDTMLKESPQNIVTLHWSAHPEKSKGMWVDPEKIGRFKFRSDWYHKQAARTPSAVEIARELDIDYSGSSFAFFGDVVEKIKDKCRAPDYAGEMSSEAFTPRVGGRMRIWGQLDDQNCLPSDRPYTVGADIAMGTGASNSVLSVIDNNTKAIVAEFATNKMRPDQFADVAVDVCRWLRQKDNGPAHLIFERQGPGEAFGNRVLERGHMNVYFHRNEKTLSKKPTDTPGWSSTRDNKNAILHELRRALHAGELVNPIPESVAELKEFICHPNEEIAHSKQRSIDPTDSGRLHGDRTISVALAWHAAKTYNKKQEIIQDIPIGSLASRRVIRVERQKAEEYW